MPKSLPILGTLLLLLLLLVPGADLYAQSLNASDLTNVRAAELSDTQLREFLRQAQAQGITADQALVQAQARGLSAAEIGTLRQRIGQIQPGAMSGDPSGLGFGMGDTALMPELQRPERIETELMRRTFGSSVFRQQATERAPSSNVPTPVNYTLGAGDQIMITVWGDQIANLGLMVNPDGTVMIENLGPVMVSGLTLKEAEEVLLAQMRQLFSGMRGEPDQQTTYARVSVNRLRSIQVAVTGEAVNPGNYTITSGATVLDVLYRAGGPAENGSYRKIRVVRNDEIISEPDLYDLIVEGVQRENIHLRDGDNVHILPYQNRIEVVGEARRGDLLFETLEGEALADLLHFAGGFAEQAYRSQIRIHRNTASERRIITVGAQQFEETEMQNGDVVYIDRLLSRFENRVSISGAVWRSGDYELRPGMTLSDLIEDAGGVRPDAFSNRALINRLRDDLNLEQISFDLGGLLQEPERHDIRLLPEDHIRIRSIHQLTDEQTVEIDGAVREGGFFAYRENMTLEDLVLKADGFRNSASEARIEISRRISGEAVAEGESNVMAEVFTFSVNRDLTLNHQDAVFTLQPFDQVQVYRRPNYREQITVTIQGEVRYPGTYTISDRSERVSDIVRRAGGVTNAAYLPGARITRKLTSFDRAEINLDEPGTERVQSDQSAQSSSRTESTDSANGSLFAQISEEERERTTLEQRAFLNRLNRINYEQLPDSLIEIERVRRIGLDLERVLRNPGTRDDLYVRDGDVIRIPEELQTVAVLGAVMQDVEVRYQGGRNFRDYVDRAGGFSENARRNRAYVVYANGDVNRRRSYLFGLIRSNPSIEPGAQIIVPEKLPGEDLTTAQIISLTSSAATTALLLLTLIDRLGD